MIILTQHFIPLVKKANIILVTGKGSIIESGTHEELINKHEIYYNKEK